MTDSYGRRSPNLNDDHFACYVFPDGGVFYSGWSVSYSCGHSPGLNNDNDGCFIAKIGSAIPYDGDWDPNFFIDNSYGKFQSKLITVKEFFIPSILEALNYDFYVGHVYGLS